MSFGAPTLAESEIPFIPESDEHPVHYGAEISAKLDRIIELLEQMVQPEESDDSEPACPECGSDELERYATAEDGADKAICTTCNHRFLLGALSG